MKETVDWIALIKAERVEQDEKWGEQNHHDFEMFTILGEEVGEVGKAVLEQGRLENELIQVAAVCVMWLEAIHRDSEVANDNTSR